MFCTQVPRVQRGGGILSFFFFLFGVCVYVFWGGEVVLVEEVVAVIHHCLFLIDTRPFFTDGTPQGESDQSLRSGPCRFF